MAALLITERTVADVVVLELRGRITIGDGDVLLRASITRCLERGDRKFVLDLTELLYIDSSGLGELVKAYSVVTHQGGQLLINHPWKNVEELFSMTKLYTVFRSVQSLAELLPELSQEPVFSRCPRCASGLSLHLLWQYQPCARCGVEFKLSIPDGAASELEATVIRLMAYDGEGITIWPNVRPVKVEVSGRLDVTAADIVVELAGLTGAKGLHVVLADMQQPRTARGWKTLGRLRDCTVVVAAVEGAERLSVPTGLTVTDVERGYDLQPRSLMIPVHRAGPQ